MTEDLLSTLPPVIGRFVSAINSADTDAFVATFTADGSVDDWGRVLQGPDGVRSWAQTDAIGAGAQMRILSAEVDGARVTTRFSWVSRVFTGESTGIFDLEDDAIRAFIIPPHA